MRGLVAQNLSCCEPAADVTIVVRCIVIDVRVKRAGFGRVIVIAADVRMTPLN